MKMYFKDDAFFHAIGVRDSLQCIRVIEENGKVTNQEMTIRKVLPGGQTNPDWIAIMNQLGENKIVHNTEQRISRKQKEHEQRRAVDHQKRKASEMEQLFTAKLQAFEIEEISKSKNRKLKSKIRQSKSPAEMNAYVTLLLGMELGIIDGKD